MSAPELAARPPLIDTLEADDPRRDALQRLGASRERLGVALRPSPRGEGQGLLGSLMASLTGGLRPLLRQWRHWQRRAGQAAASALNGGAPSALLEGAGSAVGRLQNRVLPWMRRHPVATVAVGAAAGAGLYLLRGWLVAAATLRLRRSWRVSQAILAQQLAARLADPALHAALLQALDAWLPPSPPAPAQQPAAPHNAAPNEAQESAACDESSSTKKVVSASPPSP